MSRCGLEDFEIRARTGRASSVIYQLHPIWKTSNTRKNTKMRSYIIQLSYADENYGRFHKDAPKDFCKMF